LHFGRFGAEGFHACIELVMVSILSGSVLLLKGSLLPQALAPSKEETFFPGNRFGKALDYASKRFRTPASPQRTRRTD
ncbi:MAG: hypothetical protein AB3X38_10210, partial [Leptothrix ochracea]|uniref:hypothetical protein n=1 Tax=Leptothrix ochracea TaxID=735331 RepID=UPI0034E24D16